MTEAENTGVPMEAAAPEATEMGEAQEPIPAEENTVQTPEPTDQELNFRRLRESNEQLQKERDEYRQYMMAMQEQLMKQGVPQGAPVKQPEPEPVDPWAGADPSDWMTVEQAQRATMTVAEQIAEKKARALLEEYDKQRKAQEAPQRIRSKFNDYDSVVTKENVEQLRAREPDIAQALSLIADEEAQAVAAYKYIKAFVPGTEAVDEAKQRLAQNAEKPKSASSMVAASPLSQASTFEKDLTPELQKQLYADMLRCAGQA